MSVTFEVAKEKGGRWYVCKANSKQPISGTFRKDKKDCFHIAADLMGIPYKEYLKLRKNNK